MRPMPGSDTDELHEWRMRTRMGIIGDKVGSGKSYVVMALLATPLVEAVPQIHVSTHAINNIVLECKDTSTYINVNVLVIPHNLIKQWGNYLVTNAPTLKVLPVLTANQVVSINTISNIEDYNVILVSSTFYSNFVHNTKQRKLQFARLIFDEVDSVPLKKAYESCNARFIWFVTASYKNLLYPGGQGDWDHNTQRYVMEAGGIKSAGYVRSLFQQVTTSITSVIVVKNSDAFVNESLQCPEMQLHLVRCKTPRTIKILDGLVDRNIIGALHANDVEGAMRYISASNRSHEDNIISILLEKYTRVLLNAKKMAQMIREELMYDNEQIRQQELERVKKTQDEYEKKISNIDERIRSTDTCCICLDNITNKTIVDCCKNAFCFRCITESLTIKQECPYCRETLGTNNLYVVSTTESDATMLDVESSFDSVSCQYDKLKNMEIVIKKIFDASALVQGKILIFSSYDNTFDQARELLERLNLEHMMLKGSNTVIASVVNKYKTGSLNILLVNPINYGSGLNLENTTDIIMMHKMNNEIERQVIGRAQRYGRTCPLRVWYLVHENEVH
jgi:hypothetical protein